MPRIILIVEDEEPIRTLLNTVLTDEGFQTVMVEDGEQALSTLTSVKVDLITLDLNMPKMDGHKLLKHLAETSPSTPVVVITANESKLKEYPQIKKLIRKPFDLDDLLAVVKDVLKED